MKSNNRYKLSPEVKNRYLRIFQAFIESRENLTDECKQKLLKGELTQDFFNLNLNDTELNPYTASKLLEEMGYIEEDFDHNGWQFDYWITMIKTGSRQICVNGTGITFELNLTVDNDYKE